MSNLHRILWIDAELRAERYPNASSIAGQFEISRRQAARDIEYMRDSLGAPLEFCAAQNGYRYASETFSLPALYLSERERRALDAAVSGSQQAAGEAGQVFARFLARAGGLRAPEQLRLLVPPGLRPNAAETRNRLQRAIEARRVVVVKGPGPASPFRVVRLHPYRFALTRGDIDAYIVGHCEHSDSIEAFHLGFIDEVELTETRFREVPAEPPQLPGFVAPYVAEVVIGRASLPAVLARDADWIEPTRCRIPFESSEILLSALLGQPAAFRIAAPGWLARRLAARLARLLAENGG